MTVEPCKLPLSAGGVEGLQWVESVSSLMWKGAAPLLQAHNVGSPPYC
ncbi:hypothetical protein LMG28727_06937 [Paraburkholderia kirstenboschensis]|nr:hypothetical protein LMG28727_06937 [Paraburkholderia kirstenboschensis]